MTSTDRTLRTSLRIVEGKRPPLREFLLHRRARNTAPAVSRSTGKSLPHFSNTSKARASEMIALNVGDLDLRTGSVLIRPGKRVQTADNVPRLQEPADGGRLKRAGLRDLVRRSAKDAGVDAPTLHAFRWGFAVLSLRNGADVYGLQRLMGHTSLAVLRRYLKQTEDDLREAHRRTGPVDRSL